MINNCYIHIPFCKNICSYCDFCKVFYNEKLVDKYLNSLEYEIKSIYNNELQETIYIGGGTPSSLNLEELEKLFKILNNIKKDSNTEYTIECNFSTITKEKLLLFKKYGINRLSFGIESISNKNLDLLGRNESKEQITQIISLARTLGFSNINLDLMYAIPGESIEELKEDLDFIISLDPEHISTYSLIIEENTKLYINNTKEIDEDIDYLMYNKICSILKDKYQHYEISNFAKNGYQSRHNLCYWKNKEYYGFGVSASSYRNNTKYTNTKSITKYNNNDYKYLEEKITEEDKMSYEMILGLRLLEGVSKEEFYNKYNIKIEEYFDLDLLIKNKLLSDNNTHYFINEDKLYVSNEILLNFIKE